MKSTNAKPPVVGRKVKPLVRVSDISVKDQYSYMAWLAHAAIVANVKAAQAGVVKAKAELAEMKKYQAWMKAIAARCERGVQTDRDIETVRGASHDMFK